MALRKRTQGRKSAPAIVIFKDAVNEKGEKQLCVYARCIYSNRLIGPVWGHAEQSIRRALTMLTQACDCPARFHKAQESRGKRITGRLTRKN